MFGVEQIGQIRFLIFQKKGEQSHRLAILRGHKSRMIFLRSEWGLDGVSHYSYSHDGIHFYPTDGTDYQLQWGNYRGDRLGMFTYNSKGESGVVTFDVIDNRYDLP
jgi:hypothetical protein